MAVQTQIQARRGTAATWTSTNPTLAAGEMGFETDTGKFKIGTGSAAWTALGYAGGGQNTLSTYVYTATSGQTTFSGADSNGNTLSYTVGAIQVYLNGALLTPTSDFTASTGTSVVLVTGALTSDTLTVLALGSFTVSTDIAKSTLSTKGDILTATAASTPAVLAVGSDGSSIVADSSTSTGLRYQANTSAGKNAVYNSATEIWQRGTTFTNTVGYTADRWYQAASNVTTTQETTIVPTGFVTSIKGTTTASSQPYWLQALETKDSIRFAGQTATISVYGATSDNSNMFIRLDYSTSTDNAALGTWTTIASTNVSASSTIARLASASFAVPSTAKSLRILTGASGSIASGATVTFTGVQMEVGSVATAFARQSGTIQGELAACQRYFLGLSSAENVYTNFGVGVYGTSTIAQIMVPLPVTMRVKPSISVGTVGNYSVDGVTGNACSNLTAGQLGNQMIGLSATTAASTTGYGCYLRASNTASALIQISAEL